MSNQTPYIYISPEAKQVLDAYIQHCDLEISGLGRVVVYDGTLYIDDIVLIKQECGPASTDMDTAAVAAFICDKIKAGEDPSQYRVWWHSHVNMGVTWSDTDNQTIRGFNNQWMVSIVGNKRGEYRARFDMYNPVRLTLDNCPLSILYPRAEDLDERIKAEITDKVRVIKPKVVVHTGKHKGTALSPSSKTTSNSRQQPFVEVGAIDLDELEYWEENYDTPRYSWMPKACGPADPIAHDNDEDDWSELGDI